MNCWPWSHHWEPWGERETRLVAVDYVNGQTIRELEEVQYRKCLLCGMQQWRRVQEAK